jgi:hypothetical protein
MRRRPAAGGGWPSRSRSAARKRWRSDSLTAGVAEAAVRRLDSTPLVAGCSSGIASIRAWLSPPMV